MSGFIKNCPRFFGALLLVVIIFDFNSALAQSGNKSIQFSSIIEQVLADSDPEKTHLFENYEISASFSLPGASFKNLGSYLSERYPELTNNGRFTLARNIEFSNCRFNDNLALDKIDFGSLIISNSYANDIAITDCKFASLLLQKNSVTNSVEVSGSRMTSFEFKDNKVDYEVYMEMDTIVGGDVFIENNTLNNGEFLLVDSYVNGSVTMGNNHLSGILLENSTFELPVYGEFNNYKLPGNGTSDLYLTGNHFLGDSTSKVYFNKGNYLNLDVRRNKFECDVYFIENNINDRFFLVENEFLQHVSFEKFLFSETWNELYWKQLAGYKLRFIEYGGNTNEELNDEIKFKNLINIYKGLHTIFLSRGDLESANACYSEMKQLQGRMLKHIYLDERSFGSFLRWQLNVLLKVYTNHGTDPGLAVVMSFFVIIAFSVLYLFFPSEWDSDSLKRLLISYENFLHRERKKYMVPFFVVVGSALLTLVNAITLSINSFVTLGFGSIPTRGFARYLCIIEGFLGWFLLSIFTVALINQVLA